MNAPMKAVLVDDEQLARNELRRMLQAASGVELIGEARNVAEAVALIDQLRPTLVFLDIQMPDGDGFAVLEQIETSPFVIFTTAFDHHALRAFEVSALDYLLKPIATERLAAALARAAAWASAAPARGAQAARRKPAQEPNRSAGASASSCATASDAVSCGSRTSP